MPKKEEIKKMAVIVNYVWCLFCNHQFFAVDDNDSKYNCPKCKEKLDFHEETCRYIVDK